MDQPAPPVLMLLGARFPLHTMNVDLPKQVAENIDHFTGRSWLLPKLLEWWERGKERLLFLTGNPGTGKSMKLAWLAGHGPPSEDPTAREQLVRLRTLVKATHFCIAASRNKPPRLSGRTLQSTHRRCEGICRSTRRKPLRADPPRRDTKHPHGRSGRRCHCGSPPTRPARR
jgi:hypothetical protein